MKKVLQSVARRFGFEIRHVPPSSGHAVFSDALAPDTNLLALRSLADRAARFSASPEQSEAIRHLYLTGILRERAPTEEKRIEIGNAGTMEVGNWRKQSRAKDASFVRIAASDSWARQETIEPKRVKWRVALIGESVARGYLYDPDFTPASALEQMLRSHLGTSEIEVVDLAMNSITMQPLKVLIGQSLALSPDVIVIFAGNNWHMHLSEYDLPYLEGSLRKDGIPRLKSYIDSKVAHAVRQLTDQVDKLVSGRKIPIIWVVPESNLDDWHDPISTAPLLPQQGNSKWRDLGARASLAFADRDLARAEQLAKEMVELDGATNSVPLRILAECCRSRVDLKGAKRYLQMCRDADGWDPSFAYTPRTSVVIQNALREAASIPNHTVVDLPEIFSRHLHDLPPNRRLFLDYCHLTAEGINLAMAAVGAMVLKSIGHRPASSDELQSRSSSPAEETEGKACLLAAIHNAHYYQSYELAAYRCERALRFWPKSAQIMLRFVDFQTRRADTMACKSAIEMSGRPWLLSMLRDGKKRLDLLLIDAMVERLAAAGTDIRSQVSELRAHEHSLTGGSKDLTDFYYNSTMLRPFEPGWTSKSFSSNRNSHCIYTSAFCETSKFVFIGTKGRPIGLKLTYRVPGQHGSTDTITIDLNGQRLTHAPAVATWRSLEVLVSGELVAEGLNEVVITWPAEGERSDVLLDRVVDALLARRVPYFYRVFGEIHSLLAFDPRATLAENDESRGATSEATMTSSNASSELVAAD